MPKISDFTEETSPNVDSYLVASLDGVTNKVRDYAIPLIPYRGKMLPYITDMLGAKTSPYTNAAIASGTMAQVASIADHPGIHRITSAAGANSGFRIYLTGDVLLGGGEVFETILMINSTTNLLVYAGFADASPPTAPTDGVWINISGTTLTGKTANNTTTSTTVSSYVVTTATWYRLKITVNTGATLVTFAIYNASGTLLWSDTLSTNIPTAAARLTRAAVAVIKTAITATSMADIDLVSFWCNYPQVR